MVTHDPDIARQADRRIELAHGHLHFDTAQHGPGIRWRARLQILPTAAIPPPTTKSVSITCWSKYGSAARKASPRR
jgi:hypothetical protein